MLVLGSERVPRHRSPDMEQRSRTRTAGRSEVAKKAEQPPAKYIHVLGFTFPDCHHSPSEPTKLLSAPPIPLDISAQLQGPIAHPRFRSPSVLASLVVMPKTAVDEDDLSPSREHQIGRPRQGSFMKRVTVSEMVQKSADNELRPRVLATNPAHNLTAPCWIDSIHRLSHEVSRYNLTIGSQSLTSRWQNAKRQG